ncbi:hypothetical protein K438DRAFT_1812395 [Mycena galopus ATCC 62051]|nr:hypothetical protein K438DRAFT_1812395 [Mycena galopus ATCC 62051]
MAVTPSVESEQSEPTKQSSRVEIGERSVEESELKITSLESRIRLERATTAVLISPIRTLPVELLAEIFGRAIDDDTHIEDAFRISQVCSDWRQVAHSTPLLWTRCMKIDLRKSKQRRGICHVDGPITSWLARSAPLPVPISLTLAPEDIDHCVLEEVLRIAPRWKSLELRVLGSDPTPSPSLVNRIAECRLDSLEELDLGMEALDDEDIDLPAFPIFTAPRLRRLTMSTTHYHGSIAMCMPWSQLTDLALNSSLPNIALDTLAWCPNLIWASVSTSGWNELPKVDRDIFTLSHLHTLSLFFFGSAKHVTPFFNYFAAPALAELRLDFGDMFTIERWTEAHFSAFQLRAPHITRLEFYHSDITSDDLRTVIRLAPFLTHLTLRYSDHCVDDALIGTLSCKDGVTPMGSHLHTLVLENHHNIFTEDILAGMIASRWWTDAELASHFIPPAVARWTLVRLWSISRRSGEEFSQRFLDAMEDLRSRGLPLDLKLF